jgi:putative oxidoreductase
MNTLHIGKYISVLLTGLMVVLGSCTATESLAQATTTQTTAKQKLHYAVLISQPNHLKAAVNTAETITPSSQYNRGNFVIMACSKSVEAFVKGSGMTEAYDKGKAAGVTYKVCGLSLLQFNIDPATLLDGVEVIPNGLTYMIDLQRQGYTTVEL